METAESQPNLMWMTPDLHYEIALTYCSMLESVIGLRSETPASDIFLCHTARNVYPAPIRSNRRG